MSQFESRSEDNEAAGELSPSSLAVGTAWGWPCSVAACGGEELSPCHGTTLALGSQGSAQRVPLGPSPMLTSLKAASGCLLSLTTRFVTGMAKVLSDGSSLKPPSPAPRHLGGKKISSGTPQEAWQSILLYHSGLLQPTHSPSCPGGREEIFAYRSTLNKWIKKSENLIFNQHGLLD